MSIAAASHAPPNSGAENRQAAHEPQRKKTGQRIAVDRQPSGPIGNCREQKAGAHRADMAVDHLMDVPVEWVECGRQ